MIHCGAFLDRIILALCVASLGMWLSWRKDTVMNIARKKPVGATNRSIWVLEALTLIFEGHEDLQYAAK